MRTFITEVFYGVTSLWILCSLIIGIAWLFDSTPNNLYWVWIKLCNTVIIAFLFFILFGKKRN